MRDLREGVTARPGCRGDRAAGFVQISVRLGAAVPGATGIVRNHVSRGGGFIGVRRQLRREW